MNTPKNRGKNSGDDKLFGSAKVRERMLLAVEDLNYLMGRGYAQKSALLLIGNRYRLNVRQQKGTANPARPCNNFAGTLTNLSPTAEN